MIKEFTGSVYMNYIRIIIEYMYHLLVTPVIGVLCSVFSFIDRRGHSWWFLSRLWSYCMLKIAGMTGLYITGNEKLDMLQGVILMSNHSSLFDPPVMISAAKKNPLSFFMKWSLFYVPLFGLACYLMGHIYITRGNPVRVHRSMIKAGKKIREGKAVYVFPEGRISTTGSPLEFKNGGLIVAITGKVPIIPAGIAGTRNILPPYHHLLREKGPVVVVTGSRIETTNFTMADKDILKQRVRDEIENLVNMAEVIRSEILEGRANHENSRYFFWSRHC